MNTEPDLHSIAMQAAEEIDRLLAHRLPPDIYIKFTPANQEIAAIIERCLAGGGESTQKVEGGNK